MIHSRHEGAYFKYGINYTWKERNSNTLLAIYLQVPIFILPPHLQQDFYTYAFLKRKSVVIWRVGFRLRFYTKGAWETLKQRLIFTNKVHLAPFGKRKWVK